MIISAHDYLYFIHSYFIPLGKASHAWFGWEDLVVARLCAIVSQWLGRPYNSGVSIE